MFSLLKIEWLKLKSYRAFWVMMTMYVVMFPVAMVFVANFALSIKKSNMVTETIFRNYFAFPDVWQSVAFFGGFFLLLPVILLIILVTNEFTFRTHRQNIIDGWSRTEFISAKLIILVLFALIATVMVAGTSVLVGYLQTPEPLPDNIFYGFHYVPYFFLQSLLYLLVGFLIALLFKRSGLAIGFFLLLIGVIDNILGFLMNKYLSESGYFFPTNAADNLVRNPFLDVAKSTGLFDMPYSDETIIAACVGYVVLFTGFLFWRFRRTDL